MAEISVSLGVHSFVAGSRANGPGVRAVVWVQGCTLGCVGCFNPQTHSSAAGETLSAREVAARVLALAPNLEGFTISGGEPLQQLAAVTALSAFVRSQTSLSSVLFFGYSWEEIQSLPGAADLLANIDVLIAGRCQARGRLGQALIGSKNQTMHFLTGRYTARDFTTVPDSEILITATGEVQVTGIQPSLTPKRSLPCVSAVIRTPNR